MGDLLFSIMVGGVINYLSKSVFTYTDTEARYRDAKILKIIDPNVRGKVNYSDVGEVSDSNIAHNRNQATIVEEGFGTIITTNNPLSRIGY